MAISAETRSRLDALVERRIRINSDQIRHSLHQISIGNPLGAEMAPERAVGRLQVKMRATQSVAADHAEAIRLKAARGEAAEKSGREIGDGREAIWGETLDFLDVSFLDRGAVAADAVARIAFRDGRAQGTGLLVAPGLLLTNHHVIGNGSASHELCAQFRYQKTASPRGKPASYGFAPDDCFVTDGTDGLDFTLIRLGPLLQGDDPNGSITPLPLSDAPDKHMLGEVANIIQHPRGRYKEIVLHENQLVGRDELAQVLHYVADTEPGASGSPVFNNDWEVIALHHWGGPWLEQRNADGVRREINEGIRISAIVKHLRARLQQLHGPDFAAVQQALEYWDARRRPHENAPPIRSAQGTAMSYPEAQKVSAEDFSDRGGYEPGFLHGFSLPLPVLPDNHTAARNLKALIGDDPFELRYHHFSIVMNAERRLAYFTACNIDGSRTVAVKRGSTTVTQQPSLQILGVESAEASDDFRPDPRLAPDDQMTRPFYESQIVRGYPDPQSGARKARIFQKGHIILRGDPVWGVEQEAVAAERDTFFYTNAAPQVGFFNQGSAANRPGSKGKLHWRAVETYVLRNAYTMRQRVTVFAGPIFKDDDPEYRFGSTIPLKFWKIACWVEDGTLKSIALVADQAPLLKIMPESLEAAMEAFDDDEELRRISEFLSTVSHIESETGLNFGDAIRNADLGAGEDGQAETVSAEAIVRRRSSKSSSTSSSKIAKKSSAQTAKKKKTSKAPT